MLAWQVIDADGYTRIDPTHTHGGPDGGGDAKCERDGEIWVMAAYFPLGQKTPATIKRKLENDIKGAKQRGATGVAFVTNQEITLADREAWEKLDPDLNVDLFHLLRVTEILNKPEYAQTREEFLDIIAGPPPMLINASVIGTAHSFTEDAEVFERYVAIEEKQIRKQSDAGHTRVRAEQEKRQWEAAARPWSVGASMSEMLSQSGILDSIAKQYGTAKYVPNIPGMSEPPPPPEPLTDEQIEAKVAEYRAALAARWPSCRDYLAGIAWAGLQFRIKNLAKSFLNDVQVILTFHGARGVDWEDQDEFELLKVQDPNYVPTRNPLYYTMPLPRLAPPSDYPVEWRHNDDGDLEVTITLPQLRPHPEWRSDEYADDIVLVVDPELDISDVKITYTATAQGYGEVFEGDPIVIPVEKVEMLDVLRDVIDATREES